MTNPAPSPLSSPATEMEPRPRLLTELLDKAVADYAERTAIDFLGRCWTYGEIGDMVDRAARGLQDMGLKPGDRFGLCLPNTPYFVILYFAALRIGAIVVNFNPLYTERELEHQIRDSGTRMMAVPDVKMIHDKVQAIAAASGLERVILCGMADVLPPLQAWGFTLIKRKDHAVVRDEALHVRFRALIARDAPPDPVAAEPDDIAVLQYTGGTTGVPKGAMLTHANLTANSAQMLVHVGGLRAGQERTLGVLPLFHVFANTCVLNRTVFTGGEMVLLPRFDAMQVISAVERTKASYLPGVPTMYQALLDHPSIGLADFSSLRVCISGGAPLPQELKQRFEQVTGAVLVEGYGLTESSGVISANPYEGLNKAGTIGQPLPGTKVKLLDRDDYRLEAGEGQPGELAFSGPQAMKGYWRRPDVDAHMVVDGYLRTGDVATIDADGYIRIVDRVKDMINVSGFKVFPSQIEAVLYRHPDVREAVVIGIPDSYHGESPKAFVTLNSVARVTGAELKDWLNPQLGKHERVVEVEIRETLPKTLVGKLSRKELVAEEKEKAAARAQG